MSSAWSAGRWRQENGIVRKGDCLPHRRVNKDDGSKCWLTCCNMCPMWAPESHQSSVRASGFSGVESLSPTWKYGFYPLSAIQADTTQVSGQNRKTLVALDKNRSCITSSKAKTPRPVGPIQLSKKTKIQNSSSTLKMCLLWYCHLTY